jgi:quercetin dioxygenase-like cupin family protein
MTELADVKKEIAIMQKKIAHKIKLQRELNDSGEDIIVPIEREWREDKFAKGVIYKEMEFISPLRYKTAIKFEALAGAVIPLHSHSEEEYFLVIEGKVSLPVTGETLISGQGIVIERFTPHTMHFTKNTTGIIIWKPKLGEI